MKLSDIQSEWSKDSKINDIELGSEAIKVPILHSKYLSYLSNVKLSLRKSESDYYKLRRVKYRYYRGELTKIELQNLGWEQYQGNKPLKNEMEEFLQCDDQLNTLTDKVEYYKTVVFTLEQILRSIQELGISNLQ